MSYTENPKVGDLLVFTEDSVDWGYENKNRFPSARYCAVRKAAFLRRYLGAVVRVVEADEAFLQVENVQGYDDPVEGLFQGTTWQRGCLLHLCCTKPEEEAELWD